MKASVEERVTTCPCFTSVISVVFYGPQIAVAVVVGGKFKRPE